MVTPMERAVPATIFLAASMSLALRSGILISAILVSDLGDLGELLLGELADLVALGDAGATLEAQLLLDELGSGRGLADEVEGAVLVDRDLDGDDVAGLVLRGGVERLAELHDVDLGGTEGGTDGRRGVGAAGRDLELDEVDDLLLGHGSSP